MAAIILRADDECGQEYRNRIGKSIGGSAQCAWTLAAPLVSSARFNFPVSSSHIAAAGVREYAAMFPVLLRMAMMSLSKLRSAMLLALLAGVVVGCNDGGMPMGGQVDAPSSRVRDADDDRNDDRRKRADDEHDAGDERFRIREGFGRERRMPSDETRWGKDRPMPSDRMPGRRGGWDRERKMPGDSKPSKSSKWGKDRKMPSDKQKWGKDREMPGDRIKRRAGERQR
jgi:hypothetical protein